MVDDLRQLFTRKRRRQLPFICQLKAMIVGNARQSAPAAFIIKLEASAMEMAKRIAII